MRSRSDDEDDYSTPLRGLNEYVYCPRLFHLMYVQGQFVKSVDTIEGLIAHHRRQDKTKAVTPDDDEEDSAPVPWAAALVKEMTLASPYYGIHGKFDILLEIGDETVPVEVKKGPAPEVGAPFHIGSYSLSCHAWANDQIQLLAQIALLREAGYNCNHGNLYYRETATKIRIDWTAEGEAALRYVVQKTHELTDQAMPEPLVDSKKCIRCSLNHVCMPDETLHLSGRLPEPRQLYPGRDDTGILHLVTPGSSVGKTGESIKVLIPHEREVLLPMKDVAHICCWGQVQVSTTAMLDLVERGIGITWLTGGGWLRATTTAPLEKNVQLRRSQYSACDDVNRALRLSRWVVAAKIENQRVLIRRNFEGDEAATVLRSLASCKGQAETALDSESLRGIEGYAARQYWGIFPRLLNPPDGSDMEMKGRNRRPPKDPVNALLSFGYAMLLRDFMTALHGVGLDPLYGFYHALVPGRPALALDLMEAFRPLVVDSAVLRAVNEGSLTTGDFVRTNDFCAMKPHAKKRWIAAYERRVDEMVTHPLFGYRLSYRRLFTLEARLFGRYLSGELPEYHPLTTR